MPLGTSPCSALSSTMIKGANTKEISSKRRKRWKSRTETSKAKSRKGGISNSPLRRFGSATRATSMVFWSSEGNSSWSWSSKWKDCPTINPHSKAKTSKSSTIIFLQAYKYWMWSRSSTFSPTSPYKIHWQRKPIRRRLAAGTNTLLHPTISPRSWLRSLLKK